MKRCVPLEAAAEKVCNQSSIPPLIFQLLPQQGRKVLEEAQDEYSAAFILMKNLSENLPREQTH